MRAQIGDNPPALEKATQKRPAVTTRTRVACVALALLAPSLSGAALAGKATAAPVPATALNETSEAVPSVVGNTGPLEIEARIKVPLAAGATFVGAEAPDGAVFLAQVGGVKTTVVWVVDGDGPAAVAEHVPGAVQALAADSKNLYVATDKMLLAFNRASGDRTGHWALPKTSRANASDAQLISISGSNGTALVLATRNNNIYIYRVNSASTSGARLVAVSTSAAFGPAGSVYYTRANHHLSYMSASGVTTTGPQLAYHPDGLGGGVQFVDAVAGGVVWVVEPAGQGLDATFSSYDQRTLRPVAHWDQPVDGQIAGTNAGTLVLGGDGFSHCPQSTQVANNCLYRLSPAGTLSDALPVGSALLLFGPDPAVVTTGAGGAVTYVERLT
jgi:hypothetical protein